MAVTADKVIVELDAKTRAHNREVDRTRARFDRNMMGMQRTIERTEARVSKSALNMGTSLRALAAGASLALAARQTISLADSYTRLSNSIKAVEDNAAKRAVIEERIYQAGARNGAQAEALAQLYRRAALSGDALGASQQDLLRLTDGIAASLRVEGIAAQAARGPLLQLGQALASPIVRAEELNSVLEGVPEIARAASRGMGLTVAELRQSVLAGNVTNKELFDALLKGLEETERRAARIPLTIQNSWTVLTDALGRYVGKTDDSLSATERLSQGLIALSQNLDKVAAAAAVIGTVFVAKIGSELGKEIAEIGKAVVENERHVRAIRQEGRARLEQTQSLIESTRHKIKDIEVTHAQAQATLKNAQAKHTEALAQLELQRAMSVHTRDTTELERAQRRHLEATTNLTRAQRQTRQLSAELSVAQNNLAASTTRAAVRQTALNAALARTSLAARAAAGAMGLLRGVMAFLGGPIGLAITGIAASVALIGHMAGASERRATRLQSALSILGRETDELGESTERATRAQQALAEVERIRNLREVSEALRDQKRELAELEQAYRRVNAEAESPTARISRNDALSVGYSSGISAAATSSEDLEEAQLAAREEAQRLGVAIGRQTLTVSVLEAGYAALTGSAEELTDAQRENFSLQAVITRANTNLSSALGIVADALGETSDAQRLLNEVQRAENIEKVSQALIAQEAALASVNDELARMHAAHLRPAFPPISSELAGDEQSLLLRPTLSSEATAELDAQAERLQRVIAILQGYLDRVNRGDLGTSDSERERLEKLRDRLDLQNRIDLARAQGDEDQERALTRQLDLLSRIEAYSAAGVQNARDKAQADQAALDAAEDQVRYAELLERASEDQLRVQRELNGMLREQIDRELQIARLRGDETRTRALERELMIRERVAQLEERGARPEFAQRQATQEADEYDAARRYGEHRELFSRAFSEGVRAAMNGDLKGFLANEFGNFADMMFQRAGEQIYDAIFGAPADLAKATAEGAAQGASANSIISSGFQASGAIVAKMIASSITSAGAALKFAGGGGKGVGKAIDIGKSLIKAIPGRATGGSVTAGRPYIVGENQPELFVPTSSGRILPKLPEPPAFGPRGYGGPPVVQLVVDEGAAFEPRVKQIAGPMAEKVKIEVVSATQSATAKQERQSAMAYGRMR